jgi:hypothetical protein
VPLAFAMLIVSLEQYIVVERIRELEYYLLGLLLGGRASDLLGRRRRS